VQEGSEKQSGSAECAVIKPRTMRLVANVARME